MRRTLVVSSSVLVALSTATIASAGNGRHGRPAVTVSPPSGSPRTEFVVRFLAPDGTGASHGRMRRYLVTATTAHGAQGCLIGASQGPGPIRAGEHVRTTLSARGSSLGWCLGSYSGSVREVIRPVCGAAAPCPMLVASKLVGHFRFRVKPGAGGQAPVFAGLQSAFACTPGAQHPGETTPFTLSWDAATDPHTPTSAIVYDVFEAARSGGENFASPTWTTGPGVTTFRTPGLPSHGTFYFVVRARNAAGIEDQNKVERRGIDPCL